MARKPKKHYSIDFEATTDINDCRVWAFGVMNIYDENDYHTGNNITDCIKFMSSNNGDYYFHNLKYDGKFIIDYLLKNGYDFTLGKLTEKTFTTIIADTGAWYCIDILFGYKGKTERRVKVMCSLKKIPFSVSKIAKDFKLPILKGSIDYHKHRPIGHIITADEHAYLKNDVQIVAMALRIQFDENQTKMTIGSDSLNAYKDSIGGNKEFKRRYPVLPKPIDDEIRKAYRGGFTWCNPKYQGIKVGVGCVYDVNSLYPFEMYDKFLPYGVPSSFEGKYVHDDVFPLYIQRIKCEFEIKDGFIPTVQIKNSRLFNNNEYLTSSDNEPVLMYMTNYDIELLFDHYDVYNVEYLGGFKFMGMKGSFKKFIDHWSNIKANNTGAIRELAKLILNNLYGKFASNPKVTSKIPVLMGDKVRYVTGEDDYKDPVYTAVGVFITSSARNTCIRSAQKNYDRILYCDTDSIHLLGAAEPPIKIHATELGAWKYEGTFKNAKFLRQKTYIEDIYYKKIKVGNEVKSVICSQEEHTHTELSVKVSGMPNNVKEKINFDNFNVGFKADGKLMPRTTSGGVVFLDTTFTIK